MNLSRISLAINQLCKDLAPAGGAQPPTPGGWEPRYFMPVRWISVDEARAIFDARDLAGSIGSFYGGVRVRGPVEDHLEAQRRTWLREGPWNPSGWWCAIGGMPPVYMPLNVTLEDAQAAYPSFACRSLTESQATKVWFDEADEIDPIKFQHLDLSDPVDQQIYGSARAGGNKYRPDQD